MSRVSRSQAAHLPYPIIGNGRDRDIEREKENKQQLKVVIVLPVIFVVLVNKT